MREFFQFVFRLGWTMPLMVFKQLGALFVPGTMRPPAVPVLAGTTEPVLSSSGFPPASGNSLTSPGNTGGHIQPPPTVQSKQGKVSSGNLNTSRLIVLGEGLAAGVGDFSLSADTQAWSFPAQMARQMNADFPQRLIQAPGLGNFVGFPPLPVRVPAPMQTTVLEHLPPAPVFNLSVPEFRLDDALELRPMQPLVQRNHSKQTAVNFVWGVLPIAQGQESLPTQLEYAVQQSPTLVIIELGYYEALEAAVNGDPNLFSDPEELIARYSQLLSTLKRTGAEILVLNIPNPFDTAHFSSVEVAAKIVKVESAFLIGRYGIKPDELITLNGLNEIGFQLFRKSLQALPPNSLLSSGVARDIANRIEAFNQALAGLAQQNSVALYDLAALFRKIANNGYPVGGRMVTREYLGGFYSLNGYYPSQTGQAIIANEILALFNTTYGSQFPPIDLNSVISRDPAAASKQTQGPIWPSTELEQLPFNPNPESGEDCADMESGGDAHFSVENNWRQLAPVTPPAPAKSSPDSG